MHGQWTGWGYGMGIGGWLFMTLFWVIIIVGIAAVVRWLLHLGRSGRVGPAGESALDILKRRYARGEIDREEYQRMKRDLE